MRKLFLKVSESVPELPQAVLQEPSLTIKRVKRFVRPSSHGITAYLLDAPFVSANAAAIRTAGLAPGSLLIWNPSDTRRLRDGLIPGELIFDEVLSFKHPELVLRTARNLYRRLFLERELARKEEALSAKNALNEELLQVGIALSAERDNDKLLSYIVLKTREIARADAGTLYLLEKDEATGEQRMRFKISQNDSNPTDFTEFTMALSEKTIAGYVAARDTVLNIEDAYEIPPDREYGFNNSYDLSTGYRSKSMLTVPMKDHKGEILGVIQLINRKKDFSLRLAGSADAEKQVVPFTKDIEPVVLSLASQAAVSLENNNLYEEIERLFRGFVDASVKAIESRDPTTSGHSGRVARLTVGLARAVDRAGIGLYQGMRFTAEHLKEIEYASLLHDFGKIGVPENVLVKADKLYPHQMEMLKLRFDYIGKSIMYSKLKERFNALHNLGMDGYLALKGKLDSEEQEYISRMKSYLKNIDAANVPTVLAEEPSRVLEEIRKMKFEEEGAQPIPFLTEDEYVKLKVPKGSLDEWERLKIESHVSHTYAFLKTIPWTKEMRDIPIIAGRHHEKLDGSGYPEKKLGEEIRPQTRMMTISDIYDALTASDRPYKKAVPPRKALDILSREVGERKLDPDLVKIFIDAKIWEMTIEKA